MRKNLEFVTDRSNIKIPFDELMYDLIFVIVISKVTAILFSSHVVTWQVVVSSLIMFISLLWVWQFRLYQLNMIHILQSKLDDYSLKSEKLTYLEIVFLTTLLFSIQMFNYQYLLLIIVIEVVVTHFGFNRLRRQIISNADTHHRFHQIHRNNRPKSELKVVNVEYIYERFGVVFVLFMGEILSAAFNQTEQISSFFIVVILVVTIFNNNIKILESSKEYVEAESDARVYRLTVDYAKSLLTLLLSILVCIEASSEFKLGSLLTLVILIFYFIFEHRMKSAMGVKSSIILFLVNISAIVLIILNLPLIPVLKIIFGILVFGLNFYIVK